MDKNNLKENNSLTNDDILNSSWYGAGVYGLPTSSQLKNKNLELSNDDLILIIDKLDQRMKTLILRINYDKATRKDLEDLHLSFNICKICERIGIVRNIKVGYYKETDLSTVQKILQKYGLIKELDEKQKHTK